MTPEAIEELRRLEREAFKAPWTYSEWEIECPDHDSIDDCKNPECDGSHVPCTTIESPDEYPDGQVVAQITCPGLSCLADKQGAFIVAMRNALPALLDAATLLASERTIRRELEERLGKAERERDALSQVALEAIRLVHGLELGDHFSHEPCGECGLGGRGAIRDALTKALGRGYTKLAWGSDMNVDREKWDAALESAASLRPPAPPPPTGEGGER